METLRSEILEFVAVALAELRGIAQPREFAELRELEMDAADAGDVEHLRSIYTQAKNLRLFCERRKMSATIGATTLFPKRGAP
jgi:hypothetical protein